MEEQTKQTHKELNRRIRGRIANASTTIVLVTAVLLCLYVVIQVMCNGYATFGGFSLFRVVTGSMEPNIPVGAILLSQQVDIETVELGDVICFRTQNSQIFGRIVTHRVVGIMENPQGGLLLQTQGDANPAIDGYYVDQANLVGKVLWHTGESSMLAGFVSLFTTQIGFLACIAVPSLILAGLLLRDCVRNIRGELDQALEDLENAPDAPAEMTDEEYQQMYARIRAELVEELGLGDKQES